MCSDGRLFGKSLVLLQLGRNDGFQTDVDRMIYFDNWNTNATGPTNDLAGGLVLPPPLFKKVAVTNQRFRKAFLFRDRPRATKL